MFEEYMDQTLSKQNSPLVIVPWRGDCVDSIKHILAEQQFSIEVLAPEKLESSGRDLLREGSLVLCSIDDARCRSALARNGSSSPVANAVFVTEGDPNQYVDYLFSNRYGVLLLEESLPRLLDNTINAFYASDPLDAFSVPSILKGKFTVDMRRYERRREGVSVEYGNGDRRKRDRRGSDRRQNLVIPVGNIIEFGEDALTVRQKIIDTVMKFFDDNDLDYLKDEPTVQIGIDELVTNILKHAYGEDEQKLAHLILIKDRQKGNVIFYIQDYKGNFSKQSFLEEMSRTYNHTRVKTASDLGTGGTGFRFARNCSDLLIVNILENFLTRFILFYDTDKIRRQQAGEEPEEGSRKNIMVFHFQPSE